MAKRLIRLFGFAIHDAPGEAEAECALLQQHGIVNAVLSEDVDTIMFGCGRTLRNWSAEGTKGSKTPTHVTIYDAAKVASGPSGLDREGMVLVALMSGGDYLPEGVPGCGVKVACEAARAGFGRELCRIKRSDIEALASWKERLLRELQTNESRYFRTKHKALQIPEDFPNLEILRYYTHPVVSRQESLDRIKQQFLTAKDVDIAGLRDFVSETFDWTHRTGAIKFIRVISASLLVQRLVRRLSSAEIEEEDLDLKGKQELIFVKSIKSRRTHFSTDSTPELRISYVPADIVGIDLSAEPEEEAEAYGRQGLALNSDDEFGDEAADEAADEGEQSKGGSVKKSFDPLMLDLIWVPESILKLSVPLVVSMFEDKQRAKETKTTGTKAKRTTRSKKMGMPVGALDKFVRVTKALSSTKQPDARDSSQHTRSSQPLPTPTSLPGTSSEDAMPPRPTSPATREAASKLTQPNGKGKQTRKAAASKAQPSKLNPWTIASSQPGPKLTKSTTSSVISKSRLNSSHDPILISSSPVGPEPTPSPGLSIDVAGQATPTRRGKRHSSPSTEDSAIQDPISPALSPTRSAVSADTRPPSAQASPEPIRRARTFKRTQNESQATLTKAAPIKITSKQTSIKSFGRVTRNNPELSVPVKQPHTATIPIDLVPSDEGNYDGGAPPPPRGPLRMKDGKGSIPVDVKPSLRGGYISDVDDDPFGPDKPSDVSASSSSSVPQCRQISPADSLPTRENSVPEERDEEKHIKPKATGTTKLFMPRTSGVGAGFFGEVEVSREEADRLFGGGPRATSRALNGVRSGGKIWRRSEIAIVDLTGED